MSSLTFAKAELTAAVARGVRQCVLIGTRLPEAEVFPMQVFELDEKARYDSPATFISTEFGSETLATALEKSEFDRLKATLFVWLGGAGYRTADAAISALAFIASLPRGSAVVFDYFAERSTLAHRTHSALDALASRMLAAGGSVKYMIQPQAVAGMLRGLGFRHILDLPQESALESGTHLVSAML